MTAAADAAPDVWNPAQYLRFGDLRLRPALDLIGRVGLEAPRRIVDLGCGTGNVTAVLRSRWPQASITGIDGSAAMLARATASLPEVDWRQQDMAAWAADGAAAADAPDLILSNAALHWLGGHDGLFPALMARLAPGGVLAVQMPRNFAAPSHTLIAETARSGPWAATLAPLLRPPPVASPAVYHRWLAPLARSLDVWETEYLQRLTGPDPVAAWTKSTWLAPLLAALPADDRPAFETAYAERLRDAYPPESDGSTLFPFRRLFLIACKG